jgi:hypothetical protein
MSNVIIYYTKKMAALDRLDKNSYLLDLVRLVQIRFFSDIKIIKPFDLLPIQIYHKKVLYKEILRRGSYKHYLLKKKISHNKFIKIFFYIWIATSKLDKESNYSYLFSYDLFLHQS